MRSCQRTQVDCSVVVQHLKYIGKVKKFNKLVPDELTTNKKNIIVLKCHLLLLYATTTTHFVIGL